MVNFTGFRGICLGILLPVAGMMVGPSGSLRTGSSSPSYTVTQINAPVGYTNVTPVGIDTKGNVAGWVVGPEGAEPFMWAPTSQKMMLFPVPAGITSAQPTGFNNNDLMAVSAYTKHGTTLPYVARVVAGKPVWIQLPGTGAKDPYANTHGIDAQNEVAGSYCSDARCDNWSAVLWKFVGSLKSAATSSWKAVINPNPSGTSYGVAWSAVSGYKAGYAVRSGVRVPVIWNDTGKTPVIKAGLAPSARRGQSQKDHDIIGLGASLYNAPATVTFFSILFSGETVLAFARHGLYRRAASPSNASELDATQCPKKAGACSTTFRLTFPSTGGPEMAAFATYSSSGKVKFRGVGRVATPVCTSTSGYPAGCAALFSYAGSLPTTPSSGKVATARGTVSDLQTLIAASSGWQLTSATAINAGGQITGIGQDNETQAAYLLTPMH